MNDKDGKLVTSPRQERPIQAAIDAERRGCSTSAGDCCFCSTRMGHATCGAGPSARSAAGTRRYKAASARKQL